MTWQPQFIALIVVCCYIGLVVSSSLLHADKDDTNLESKAVLDTDKEDRFDDVDVLDTGKADRFDDVDTLTEKDDTADTNVLDTNEEVMKKTSQSEAGSSSRQSGQETKLSGAAFVSDGTVYITKAKDCKSLYEIGIYQSGVYQLHIEDPNNPRPLTPQVYCELSDLDIDGGGWTYIQSRVDDSVDFYRYWDEYEQGFGDPTGNYWIGLSALHQLTQKPVELMVYLETFEGGSGYAYYNHFSVGDAGTNFRRCLVLAERQGIASIG